MKNLLLTTSLSILFGACGQAESEEPAEYVVAEPAIIVMTEPDPEPEYHYHPVSIEDYYAEVPNGPWTYINSWTEKNTELELEIRVLNADDRNEVLCMATNIYHEARGSSSADQIGTAHVVMNRAADWRWPSTPCEVVWDDYQFSWTADSIRDYIYEAEAWKTAQLLAAFVYLGGSDDPTFGATHYHTHAVKPSWSKQGYQQVSLGSHEYMKLP